MILEFFLGKKANEKLIDSIAEKAGKYIAEKNPATGVTNVEDAKLVIEREKLALEREKLELERIKLTTSHELAQIRARSTRYSAHVRALSTIGVGIGAGIVTYLYFRPLEDELKNSKEQVTTLKTERDTIEKFFMNAQTNLKHEEKLLQKAEIDFVFKSPDPEAINNYNSHKMAAEIQLAKEISARDACVVYDNNHGHKIS